MAQFDVYRIKGHCLLLDCQSDLWSRLRARLVIPLRADGDQWVVSPRLNPSFVIDGNIVWMATQFVRSVDPPTLGKPVWSLAEHNAEIKSALDLLIFGI